MDFLPWKGLESRLARASRVLKWLGWGRGCEILVSLSLWGTCWQQTGGAERAGREIKRNGVLSEYGDKFPSLDRWRQRAFMVTEAERALVGGQTLGPGLVPTLLLDVCTLISVHQLPHPRKEGRIPLPSGLW